MATSLYVALNGTVISQYVETIDPKPTGPGILGACPMTLLKAGGGLSVLPMMRMQVARLDGSGNFEKRLFQGVVTVPTPRGEPGTNMLWIDVTCADANILGLRIVPPPLSVFALVAGTFTAQVTAIVAAVQASYGAGWEPIDCTSVPNLYATMPAVSLEGGHKLNWYLDALDATVRQLTSGAVNPARYMDVDPTAGPGTFGGVVLRYYDALAAGSSVATYTDLNNTIRHYWKRKLDGGLYYGRRAALFAGGGTTSYFDPAGLANPWCHGGWIAEPLKLSTADAAVAFATVQADVQGNGAVQETLAFPVGNLGQVPGDTVAVSLALQGLSSAPYRVAEINEHFLGQHTDIPESELVLGVSPRRLGSGTGQPGAAILRDTVAPLAPAAAPTVVSDVFDPVRRQAVIVARSVSSLSADVDSLRLRYTVGGGVPSYTVWTPTSGPGPATVDFPVIGVAPGSSVVLDVQARDTTGNEGPFGPSFPFTAAPIDSPLPPTIGAPVIRAYTGRGGGILYSATFALTLPTPNTATWWAPEHFVTAGAHIADPQTPATSTAYTLYNLKGGGAYYFWVRGRTDAYDYGSYATYGPFTVSGSPGPLPTFSLTDPDSAEVGGLLGWAAQTFTGSVTPSLTAVSLIQGKTALSLALGTSSSGAYRSDPIEAQAGQTYALRLWLKASATSGVTPTLTIRWYNGIGSSTGTSTVTLAALVAATWVLSSAAVVAPAGTTQARWEVGGTTTGTGTTLTVAEPVAGDWGRVTQPVDYGAGSIPTAAYGSGSVNTTALGSGAVLAGNIGPGAVGPAALAPKAVIPSLALLGQIGIVSNAGQEIPNLAGTAPDGWTYGAGIVAYQTGSAGSGSRWTQLGGTGTTHVLDSPEVVWLAGLTMAWNVLFRFQYQLISGLGLPVLTVRCLDSTHTLLGGGSLTPVAVTPMVVTGGWQYAEYELNGSLLPSGTCYVQLRWSYTTSTGVDFLGVDSLEVESSTRPVYAVGLHLRNTAQSALFDLTTGGGTSLSSAQAMTLSTAVGAITLQPTTALTVQTANGMLVTSTAIASIPVAVNAPAGQTANLLSAAINAVVKFFVDKAGIVNAPSLVVNTVPVSAGTSFPGSPTTGQAFYRSDLRRWGYYDGTRWTSDPYDAAWQTWNVMPYTVSPTYPYLSAQAGDYAVLVERYSIAAAVFTTNSGVNYWNVKLRTDAALGLAMATLNTSADPVSTGTWYPHEATTFTNNPTSLTAGQFQIEVTTTGAPGPLYVVVKARVRDVLT